MAFAHTRNLLGQRHDLVEHLRGVARLAREFAADLQAAAPGVLSWCRAPTGKIKLWDIGDEARPRPTPAGPFDGGPRNDCRRT